MTIEALKAPAADRNVVYVYGVARALPGRQFAPPCFDGIIPQAPVQPLVHADLIAFVSAVPASQFGPSEFRAALNQAQWLKDCVLAHEKVLEGLCSSGDVVPFRFGTIYLDASQAANALARHRTALCQALDRIRGASEWGVKSFCDRDALYRQIETASGSLRTLRDALERASPGARFFLQKKYLKAVEDEAAATIARCVERISQSLDSRACKSTQIDLQPAAVHGRSADMVMNAAYLVSEKRLGPFRQMFATLQEEFAAHGLDHELTGPWPPYHFVTVRQEGNADAATTDQ